MFIYGGLDREGYPVKSTQICYFTPESEKKCLSHETCIDLGLISSSFQIFLGEVLQASHDTASSLSTSEESTTGKLHECHCPKRSLPPPTPTIIPFSADVANVDKLKQWLLNYYAASTFNTCPRSQLPLMAARSFSLMVNREARTVATHSPIQVPLHW